MPENSRLEDLRRRVQKDPASIAFAQLAEECRRAGLVQESVDVCRAGLAIHPGYLSARVTLGRALIELNELAPAQQELERVLKSAPENLAAIRGLADIHHRRGELPEALASYQSALAFARNDPDLEQTVSELTRQVTPKKGAEPSGGLSFEQASREIIAHPHAQPFQRPVRPRPTQTEPRRTVPPPAQTTPPPAQTTLPASELTTLAGSLDDFALALAERSTIAPLPAQTTPPSTQTPLLVSEPPMLAASLEDSARAHAERTVAALESWLASVHVARTLRHA